jgi:hypothetical protein
MSIVEAVNHDEDLCNIIQIDSVEKGHPIPLNYADNLREE